MVKKIRFIVIIRISAGSLNGHVSFAVDGITDLITSQLLAEVIIPPHGPVDGQPGDLVILQIVQGGFTDPFLRTLQGILTVEDSEYRYTVFPNPSSSKIRVSDVSRGTLNLFNLPGVPITQSEVLKRDQSISMPGTN